MKACFRCKKVQEYAQFQRDCTSKDGYRSSCKSCLKARNRAPLSQKQPSHGFTIKRVSSDPTPKKVPIVSENILEALLKKFDATYTVTVRKDKKTYIQIHSIPTQKYKFLTPEGLLEIA